MKTYADMIASELFNAGWGIETERVHGVHVVKAYNNEGEQHIGVAETLLTAFLKVKKSIRKYSKAEQG